MSGSRGSRRRGGRLRVGLLLAVTALASMPPPNVQKPTVYPPPPPPPPPFYPPPPSGAGQQASYPAPPGYPPAPAYGQLPYGNYPAPPYGYGYPLAPVPGGRLASMGRRLGGLVIDYLIIGIPAGLVDTIILPAESESSGLIYVLLMPILTLVYWTLLVGLYGATLGHRIAGLRVVDVNSGQLIGPPRALLRIVILFLTGSVLIGFLSPLFDRTRRQGWHDMAARSVVIPR